MLGVRPDRPSPSPPPRGEIELPRSPSPSGSVFELQAAGGEPEFDEASQEVDEASQLGAMQLEFEEAAMSATCPMVVYTAAADAFSYLKGPPEDDMLVADAIALKRRALADNLEAAAAAASPPPEPAVAAAAASLIALLRGGGAPGPPDRAPPAAEGGTPGPAVVSASWTSSSQPSWTVSADTADGAAGGAAEAAVTAEQGVGVEIEMEDPHIEIIVEDSVVRVLNRGGLVPGARIVLRGSGDEVTNVVHTAAEAPRAAAAPPSQAIVGTPTMVEPSGLDAAASRLYQDWGWNRGRRSMSMIEEDWM